MSSPASLPRTGTPEVAPPPWALLAQLYHRLEHGFDAIFGAAGNPLKQLGALGFLTLWLLVATGSVLYIVLDTSAAGAYASIAALADVPWMLGDALRGMHRYAADAFVLVMALHAAREWALGRYRHWRRAIWATGVPLVALVFVSAIGGFWLNWDRLGQYSVVATAEWLDALPFLGAPLARNFLDVASLGDRLFTLFMFIHIGVPLLIVFGLWFHIQRISLAKAWPTRGLACATLLLLLLLALVLPVRSQGAADLGTVPAALGFDWLLLFIHPLVDASSPATGWALLALAFTLLALPALLPGGARQPVAVVYPEHCSGCERCVDDCPYSAISMVAHPSGKPGMQVAEVRVDWCASCGICAGSCPSSTPFRGMERLITGIDMPQWPVDVLRSQLINGLRALPSPNGLVVIGCAQGARAALDAPDVVQLDLVCAGALPPSFIEYAQRAGAGGVLVAGCRSGGCEFRLGQRWTAQRLSGAREPRLRASVARESLQVVWADAGDERALLAALDELRARSAPQARDVVEETGG